MNNKTYYVATYRPAYPQTGVRLVAREEKNYDRDALPPTLTSLWRVQHVSNKDEAIACVLEHAVGKGVAVNRLGVTKIV